MRGACAQQVLCERRLGAPIVGSGSYNTGFLGLLVTPADSVILSLSISPTFLSSLPTRRYALVRLGKTRCDTAYFATPGQGADWGRGGTELPLVATRRGRLLALAYQENSVLTDSGRIHLQSYSPTGQLRWDRTYRPRQASEEGTGLAEAPDYGAYFVSMYNGPPFGFNTRLTKVDSLGRVRWQRAYGTNTRNLFAFYQAPSYTRRGTLLLAGDAQQVLPNGTTEFYGQVVEVGQHGDSLTSRQFLRLPAPMQSHLYAVRPLRDGGFLLSGLLDSIPLTITEYPFWVRLDANLNTVWSYIHRNGPAARVYGYKQGFELADGTLLVAYAGNTDLHFLRLSGTGAVLNTYTFAPPLPPVQLTSVRYLEPVARDSSFVVLAYQLRGAYVGRLRLPGLRRVLPLPPIPAAAPLGVRPAGKAAVAWALYPNPAGKEVRVEYALSAGAASATLLLTDVVGRLVRAQAFPAGSTHATVPVGELAAGLYQVQLLVDGHLQATRKLSVVH